MAPVRGQSAARERRGRAERGGAGAAPKRPLAKRVRAFAFEGLPEKDRFGIFDPAVRASYLFVLMLAAVFSIGGAFDAWGASARAFALAAVFAVAVGAGGYLGFRRLWPTPVERELLLKMAREEDEARAMAADLTRARAKRRADAATRTGGASQAADVDRSADEPRKAF